MVSDHRKVLTTLEILSELNRRRSGSQETREREMAEALARLVAIMTSESRISNGQWPHNFVAQDSERELTLCDIELTKKPSSILERFDNASYGAIPEKKRIATLPVKLKTNHERDSMNMGGNPSPESEHAYHSEPGSYHVGCPYCTLEQAIESEASNKANSKDVPSKKSKKARSTRQEKELTDRDYINRKIMNALTKALGQEPFVISSSVHGVVNNKKCRMTIKTSIFYPKPASSGQLISMLGKEVGMFDGRGEGSSLPPLPEVNGYELLGLATEILLREGRHATSCEEYLKAIQTWSDRHRNGK